MADRTATNPPGRDHPVRRALTGSRIGLLLVVSTALTVAGQLWVVLRISGVALPTASGWVPAIVTIAITGYGSIWMASHAPGLSPAGRRFWRQTGVAECVLGIATASNARDALFSPGAPTQRISSTTMVIYALTVLLAVWAMLRLPVPGRTRGQWLTVALDGGIMIVAVGVLAWHYSLVNSDITRAQVGMSWPVLANVTVTFAGVFALLKVALAGTSAVDRRALWTLGGTIVLGGVTGGLTPLLAGRPYLADDMISIPLVAVGAGAAAFVQYRSTASVPRRPRRRRVGFSLLPYVAVVVADVLLLTTGNGPSGPGTAAVHGTMAITLIVIARQLVAIFENSRLVSRLDASLLDLSRHEQRFRSLVQNSSDVTAVIDPTGRPTYISPGVQRALGYTPEDWLGESVQRWVNEDDLTRVRVLFRRLWDEPGATHSTQVRLRHADGSWRWFDLTLVNLTDDPSVGGIVMNGRDVTDTRRYQDQLAYQASHDELTGLANRSLFLEHTARALVSRDGPGQVTVAMVDLDDFKVINDRLGHAVGDALLVAVAARLRACVRPADTVARLGGDEFTLLLTGLDPLESGVVADRILGQFAVPITAAGHELLIQASLGLADGTPGATADDLLRRADLAMYAAKELGKGRYVYYDDDLDAQAVENAELAAELSQAIDRQELFVLYQPIVELPSGRIVEAEALVRWVHPRDGLLSPDRFIPVAERTGLIVPIGAWILATACRQMANWRRQYPESAPERINVNVSARQLLDPEFPQTVASVLKVTGLEPERLTVEITETAVFNGGRAVQAVVAVHDLGVRIALDDFGTGHSSLGLLRSCPVDVLKVDKSFVDGVTGTVEQEAIATSIVEIAQALGLDAVAEGVETPAQADRLHLLGYRLAQGFHFARPLGGVEVERLFARDPFEVRHAPAADAAAFPTAGS